jgi:hypothetical protein
MSVAALRTAIVARAAAVAGMGPVHDRERFIRDQAALKALYVSTFDEGERLQGWFVSWRAMRPTLPDERQDTWVLVGYRAVDDASDSETEFATLADSVIQSFRDYDPLGIPGVATLGDGLAGPSLKGMDHVMFCAVLCHRIEIELITASFTAVQGV